MLGFLRRWRVAFLPVISVLVLACGATAAAAGDDEIIDVTKKANEIDKKIGELKEKGGWSRRGKLWVSAVCGQETSSQFFAAWGDTADYVPAPQGDVEDVSRWDLDDDVTLAENGPGQSGSRSLLLGDNDEAVSPVTCISTAHPTIRFFAANTGSPESTLEIEVLYEDLDGHMKKLKVAKLRGSSEWQPSLVVPIHVNRFAAASEDGLTAVALKFKAKDVKSKDERRGWKIDDLQVDPFKQR